MTPHPHPQLQIPINPFQPLLLLLRVQMPSNRDSIRRPWRYYDASFAEWDEDEFEGLLTAADTPMTPKSGGASSDEKETKIQIRSSN
ncbi:unnamed protein product [Linum trigynum]|uniref:Uncharacterized protein n=1 Tax=Linum trigynum TaxID=586398 RepID=A0AAV2C647_9ROSI